MSLQFTLKIDFKYIFQKLKMETNNLNVLNKDMLIKLIATIQEEYKSSKMSSDKLLKSIKDYNAEISRRKTVIIKKDLEKFIQFKEVINDITRFDLKATDVSMLSILCGKQRFIIRTYITAGYRIFLINYENKLLYKYYSGIGNLIPPNEELSLSEEHKKYVDFVKFLHAQMYITKIMLYLSIDKKVEDF